MRGVKCMVGVKEHIARIKSEEAGTPESRLHSLLEYCVGATGRGEVDSDYTKRITFPIGGCWLSSDPYYGRVSLEDGEDAMAELNEAETERLFKEIEKRLLKFDKRIEETGRRVAGRVFDEPIGKRVVSVD